MTTTITRGPSAWSMLTDRKLPYPYYFYELMKKYGDLVNCGYGLYLVSHPDLARHILTQDIKKYEKRDIISKRMQVVFGKGIICSQGEEWKDRRRILHSYFTADGINQMLPGALQAIDRFLDSLKPFEGSSLPIELTEAFPRLALSIAASSFFSINITGKEKRMAELIDEGSNYITNKNPLFIPPWIPTRSNLQIKRTKNELDRILEHLFRKEQSELPLPHYHALPADQLSADEIRTIMVSGSSTIAAALTSCWYFLSQYPEHLEKLRIEANKSSYDLHSGDDPAGYFPLTMQCINESMRLMPPAYVVWRKCIEEDQVGDHLIPKGASLIISLFNIHRHPDFWEDPDRFDPTRFEKDKISLRPKHAFMPFGWGPRKCLGDGFSMQVLPMVIVRMLQQYNWNLPAGQECRLKNSPAVIPEKLSGIISPKENKSNANA